MPYPAPQFSVLSNLSLLVVCVKFCKTHRHTSDSDLRPAFSKRLWKSRRRLVAGAISKDLVARLASGDADDARSAARAIAELGEGAGPAIGPLFDAVTDGAPRVKLEALKALKEVGGTNREDFIKALLKRPKIADKLQEQAADSGPVVRRAVEAVTDQSAGALRDQLKVASDKTERKSIIDSLGDFGSDDSTLEALREAAGDSEDDVRDAAEKALEKVRR